MVGGVDSVCASKKAHAKLALEVEALTRQIRANANAKHDVISSVVLKTGAKDVYIRVHATVVLLRPLRIRIRIYGMWVEIGHTNAKEQILDRVRKVVLEPWPTVIPRVQSVIQRLLVREVVVRPALGVWLVLNGFGASVKFLPIVPAPATISGSSYPLMY